MTAISLKAKATEKIGAIAADIKIIGRESEVIKCAYNNGTFNKWTIS
jgi:hypothetical protein